MLSPIRIGISGLGTVGVGVIQILRNYSNSIEIKTGRTIKIVAVSAKSRKKIEINQSIATNGKVIQ